MELPVSAAEDFTPRQSMTPLLPLSQLQLASLSFDGSPPRCKRPATEPIIPRCMFADFRSLLPMWPALEMFCFFHYLFDIGVRWGRNRGRVKPCGTGVGSAPVSECGRGIHLTASATESGYYLLLSLGELTRVPPSIVQVVLIFLLPKVQRG